MAILILLSLFATTPELPLSLAATDNGLAVFANPAGLGVARGVQLYYFPNFQRSELFYGSPVALSVGPVGLFLDPKPLRYGVALGFRQDFMFGGFRLIRDTFTTVDLGTIMRPNKWLSLAALWERVNDHWGSWGLGIGFRPAGTQLTLFAETYPNTGQHFAGLILEPAVGIKLSGRFKITKNLTFVAGLSADLGKIGVGVNGIPHRHEINGVLSYSTVYRRSVFPGPKRVLELRVNEPVVEQRTGFSLLSGISRQRTIFSVLQLLKDVANEPGLAVVVIKLERVQIDFAQAQELRTALIDLKKRGKQIWIYAQDLGVIGYYLATAGDRIILNPMGELVIPGIFVRTAFVKGTLDKLDVKPQVYRHGRYKTAVETFTEDSMSQENYQQLSAIVNGIYDEVANAIVEGRRSSSEQVDSLINRGFFRAEQAKMAGLIDTFLYEDELDSLIKVSFKRHRIITEKEFLGKRDNVKYHWGTLPRLAIVFINGNIVQGESGIDFFTGEPKAGAKTLCRIIREVTKDRKIKGIVLRINSPGGDAVAAELIWRELKKAQKRKPVVVSMGGVAASGGYYISCNAERIFALPGTVTGSIGVFSLKMITEGLYNKLGIRRQVVKKGEHADALLDHRASTPVEDSIMQEHIDWFYYQFLQRVAEGRKIPIEAVDSIAQGRVWLGKDAQQIGLVDSLDGLMSAIEFCRQRANLGKDDYEIVLYPKGKLGLGSLLSVDRGELLWEIITQ